MTKKTYASHYARVWVARHHQKNAIETVARKTLGDRRDVIMEVNGTTSMYPGDWEKHLSDSPSYDDMSKLHTDLVSITIEGPIELDTDIEEMMKPIGEIMKEVGTHFEYTRSTFDIEDKMTKKATYSVECEIIKIVTDADDSSRERSWELLSAIEDLVDTFNDDYSEYSGVFSVNGGKPDSYGARRLVPVNEVVVKAAYLNKGNPNIESLWFKLLMLIGEYDEFNSKLVLVIDEGLSYTTPLYNVFDAIQNGRLPGCELEWTWSRELCSIYGECNSWDSYDESDYMEDNPDEDPILFKLDC